MKFKKANEVPAPPLVCIEVNPGPAPLDVMTRWKIIWYKQDAGLSLHEIERKLGVKREHIREILKKYHETGSVLNRTGQGRKRKLDSMQTKNVVKKAKRGKDSPQIAREVSEKLQEPVGVRTIQRTIRRSGLRYLVLNEEEDLNENQIQRRLNFSQTHRNDDFKYVLFVDEKKWTLGGGVHKAWQDPNNKKKRLVKRHPKKINVWGGIGSYFKTRLYFFEENLNAKLYQKILKKEIPPVERAPDCPTSARDKWILIQDNDPKHRAKSTIELLDEIAPDRMQDFPALSPDFNIIEDIWSQMDGKIKHYNITSINQLKSRLKKAWKEITWQTVRTSVNSIPNRLESCIEKQGARTEY
jgi:transposase